MKPLWACSFVLALGCERAGFSDQLHRDAELATREGRLHEAAVTLERALRFDPADEVALERLVVLRLRMDNPAQALALANSDVGLRARSRVLRNARVVASLQAQRLGDGLAEAKSLLAIAGLSADTERALVDALVDDALRESPSLSPTELLPEPWLRASGERLLSLANAEPAARYLLARPERERSGAVGVALKERLLERAYREDFALTTETLNELTRAPKTALEHVGRLEYARRRGDDAEAARLEPGAEVLSSPYAAAWRLGLSRLAARRGDWYGVLELTHGGPDALARDEARRQALRSVARLALGDRAAARAELEAWLGEPAAARAWSVALLQPELGARADQLVELRNELAKARAARGGARP